MPDKVAELISSIGLFCPDDGHPLEYKGDYLNCLMCGREFPVFGGDIIELLPKEPTVIKGTVDQTYIRDYLNEFKRPFQWNKYALAWGAPEQRPLAWVEKRRRQVRWALSLILAQKEADKRVFCDLSAGAAYYTLEYSRYFWQVLHCDLSVNSLNYACFKARSLGIRNVVFLRIDYLNPPFRS